MAIKIGWWTDDSLAGTSGDDWIEGLSGEDTIEGLEGDDSLYGSSGEDSILGGDGDDTLDGGSQDDVLSGGTGEDTLDGDSGDDLLSGGADADYLTGDSGDDSLFGGTGDDTLRGGTDSDLVDGGAGDDLIIEGGYEGGNDTIVFGADSGHDTVRGFSPTDDYVHIGDASLDDVILTPTSNPKIWVMTLDGVPDASLTLDFTYYWDSGVTVEELIPQVINNNDYTLPDDPFPDPICLTMGAMVDTTAGPKPVEALRPGDQLLTYDAGPRPLVGVLRHRVPAAQLAKNPALRPVEIAAGAFGGGLPRRDMLVSMQHCFLAWDGRPAGKGEVLIRARHIAEDMGLARLGEGPMASVVYYHLLMDSHQLIRADGVWTETVYTGPAALNADPVLKRMVRTGRVPKMRGRVRKLLLRKHLKNFTGHRLGVGAPAEASAPRHVA